MKYAFPAMIVILLLTVFLGDPTWLMALYALAALAFFGAAIFGMALPFAARMAASERRWQNLQASPFWRTLLGPDP